MKRLIAGLGSAAMASSSLAQNGQDLGSMSIEDLMKVQVTTASRSKQSLGDVPAAIFVVSKEQIRASGLKTVPEMLRLVPGVQVSQIDGNKWQISIRGFGGRYSNKLQVLIDGRSIYTPLYSGVVWEANLVPVDEIERIEVIRGPGGAIWGANAINGIVNIITNPPLRPSEPRPMVDLESVMLLLPGVPPAKTWATASPYVFSQTTTNLPQPIASAGNETSTAGRTCPQASALTGNEARSRPQSPVG